jgi:small subunit ribosomal protein S21
MKQIDVNCRDMRKHREEVNAALEELKKQLKKSGILQELRRREYYVPPSKARRLKHEESLKQRIRDEKKQQWQKRSDY